MSHNNSFSYGVIEGFYGHPWPWAARDAYSQFLKTQGFGFYIYAPKADVYLRSCWQQDWPEHEFMRLQQLAATYTKAGLAFGVALSPLEIYKNWDAAAQAALIKKMQRINQLNPAIFCLLFDDMRGDLADLARLQIDITHLARAHSSAAHCIMCPTYYSCDPVLEQLFGTRPEYYWQELGQCLDKTIEIFWTGEQVCSPGYTPQSLATINEIFQRSVSLWDNYPVNDGKKTSPFLHLKAVANRPAALSTELCRHVVNPMNAAFLSQIPLISLADTYRNGVGYNAQASQLRALHQVCGVALASQLEMHVELFQEQGLDALSQQQREQLLAIYQTYQHPCAQEICQWLQDYYRFDPACLTG